MRTNCYKFMSQVTKNRNLCLYGFETNRVKSKIPDFLLFPNYIVFIFK